MIRLLIQNWWLLLIRGIFAIAFAIFIYLLLPFMPVPLLQQLAFAGVTGIFGIFATVTGAITIAAALRGSGEGEPAWLLLADGITVAAGGLIIMFSSGLTLAHVIRLIAVVTLLVGVLEISAGFHLRRHVISEWLLIFGGIVSIAFAAYLLLTHVARTGRFLSWISLYAGASGLAMTGLALRLRNLRQSIHALAGSAEAVKQSQPGVA
jgi:uncharacterized membrane protein HdeD (DUF308 family)